MGEIVVVVLAGDPADADRHRLMLDRQSQHGFHVIVLVEPPVPGMGWRTDSGSRWAALGAGLPHVVTIEPGWGLRDVISSVADDIPAADVLLFVDADAMLPDTLIETVRWARQDLRDEGATTGFGWFHTGVAGPTGNLHRSIPRPTSAWRNDAIEVCAPAVVLFGTADVLVEYLEEDLASTAGSLTDLVRNTNLSSRLPGVLIDLTVPVCITDERGAAWLQSPELAALLPAHDIVAQVTSQPALDLDVVIPLSPRSMTASAGWEGGWISTVRDITGAGSGEALVTLVVAQDRLSVLKDRLGSDVVDRVRVVPLPGRFHFSRWANVGFLAGDATHVLVLEDRFQIASRDVLSLAQQVDGRRVVAAAPLVLDSTRLFVRALGFTLGVIVPRAPMAGVPRSALWGWQIGRQSLRVDALPPGILVATRDGLLRVGGFSLRFASGFGATDASVKLSRLAELHVDPRAVAVESSDIDVDQALRETAALIRRWPSRALKPSWWPWQDLDDAMLREALLAASMTAVA